MSYLPIYACLNKMMHICIHLMSLICMFYKYSSHPIKKKGVFKLLGARVVVQLHLLCFCFYPTGHPSSDSGDLCDALPAGSAHPGHCVGCLGAHRQRCGQHGVTLRYYFFSICFHLCRRSFCILIKLMDSKWQGS